MRSMFACSTLPAKLYRYCTFISVSDPDSLIPDPDLPFQAKCQSGFGSRILISVPDPDPRVFWPPGSGSTSQRYGSGSSCKNNKKNLESYYFVTLFDFLSLKNNVNVPSKSNKQKKLC